MASPWASKIDEEDEEFVDETKTRDIHTLVLIDARTPMFERNAENEVFIENAIQVVLYLLKTTIFMSDSRCVGLTFFGGKESVEEVISLDLVDSQMIRTVKNLLNDYEKLAPTVDTTDRSVKCPLREALSSCSRSFHQCPSTQRSVDDKAIFLFTNDDNPMQGDLAEAQRVVQTARDASETGVRVELWSMSHLRPFDPTIFYAPLLEVDDEEYVSKVRDAGLSSFQGMIGNLKNKLFKKRVLTTLPFMIHQERNIAFSVSVYNNIMEAKKPNPKQLHRRTNAPLNVSSTFVCEATGTSLDVDTQVRRYTEVVDERIYFSDGEWKGLKKISSAGIVLLGFAPLSSLSFIHQIRSPYFLFPNEKSASGSTTMFLSLLMAMRQDGNLALCRFTRTDSSPPYFVALVPVEEEVDEDDDEQLSPTGFHLLFLPYADDIREARGVEVLLFLF